MKEDKLPDKFTINSRLDTKMALDMAGKAV